MDLVVAGGAAWPLARPASEPQVGDEAAPPRGPAAARRRCPRIPDPLPRSRRSGRRRPERGRARRSRSAGSRPPPAPRRRGSFRSGRDRRGPCRECRSRSAPRTGRDATTRSRRSCSRRPAPLGPEALVGQRLVDQAVADLAPAAAGLRLWTAIEMAKWGMPWMKFDVPSIGSTTQRGLAGLPSIVPASSRRRPQSGRAWRNHLDHGLLGALVGEADEVGRPAAHLELLDLAEVASHPRRRLARRAGHDGDQAGMANQLASLPCKFLQPARCPFAGA